MCGGMYSGWGAPHRVIAVGRWVAGEERGSASIRGAGMVARGMLVFTFQHWRLMATDFIMATEFLQLPFGEAHFSRVLTRYSRYTDVVCNVSSDVMQHDL